MIRFAPLLLLVYLAGCASPGRREVATTSPESAASAPLQVRATSIASADGATLLTLDALPTQIAANANSQFGAVEKFTSATLAPDREWIAAATSGAAHSAGWLVEVESSQVHPAAFQYGGEVRIGPWSADARYVVFITQGPAPSRGFFVVDRRRLGASVEASSQRVGEPADTQALLELFGWRGQNLLFEASGEFYAFDPNSGRLQPMDQEAPQLTVTDASSEGAVRLQAQRLPASTEVGVGYGPPNSEYEIVQRAHTDERGELSTTVQLPRWAKSEHELVFVLSMPGTDAEVLSEPIRVSSLQ